MCVYICICIYIYYIYIYIYVCVCVSRVALHRALYQQLDSDSTGSCHLVHCNHQTEQEPETVECSYWYIAYCLL